MPNTREKKSYLIDPREILFGLIVNAYQSDKTRENTLAQLKHIADHLVANGVTVQQWIPVTERLPKDNERVLVYHDDGMIRFGINKGGFADVVSSLYMKHNHRTCFSKATHWMPLPQPPKGE